MEERYGVKITFPRHSTDGEGKAREQLKPNEVLVKGGKKGVADAKAELLEVQPSIATQRYILTLCVGTGIRKRDQQRFKVHYSNSFSSSCCWERWCVHQRD